MLKQEKRRSQWGLPLQRSVSSPIRYGSRVAHLLLVLVAASFIDCGAAFGEHLSKDQPAASDVVGIDRFPAGGRPANLYELKSGASPACSTILEALNTQHKATVRRSGIVFISDMFLQSRLSVAWRELHWSPYVGAVKARIGSSDPEPWVVKFVSWYGPHITDVLYWVSGTVDLTNLQGKAFWDAIYGQVDEANRIQGNLISLLPRSQISGQPLSKIPLFLWELVSVDGQPLVLSIQVQPGADPQQLRVRVLVLKDRRHADELCLLSTKALISGFDF